MTKVEIIKELARRNVVLASQITELNNRHEYYCKKCGYQFGGKLRLALKGKINCRRCRKKWELKGE